MKTILKATVGLAASVCAAVFVVAMGMGVASVALSDPGPHKFSHLDAPLWTTEPVVVDVASQDYTRLPALVASADVPASGVPETAMVAGHAIDQGDMAVSSANGSDRAQGATEGAQVAALSGGAADPLQVQWCSARYRSYRAEDNSYQPYDGSTRRSCVAPGSNAAALTGPQTADAGPAVTQASVRRDGAMIGNGDREMVPAVATATTPTAPTLTGATLTSAALSASPVADGQGATVSAADHDGWCAARYRSWRSDDNTYQPLDGGPRKACVSPYG